MAEANSVGVALGSGSGQPGNTVTLGVNVTNGPTRSTVILSFDVVYDASRLTFDRRLLGVDLDPSGDELILTSEDTPGTVSVVIADLLDVATNPEFGLPDGELAKLRFLINAGAINGATNLAVANVVALDSSSPPSPYTVTTTGGTITITGGQTSNAAPVLAFIGNQSVAEGGNLSVTVSAADPDGGSLSFSASGLPGYAGLTDQGDGTATLAATPGLSDAGVSSLTVSVSDGVLTDSETLMLTVSAAPAPEPEPEPAPGAGMAVSLGSGSGQPGGTVTLSLRADTTPDRAAVILSFDVTYDASRLTYSRKGRGADLDPSGDETILDAEDIPGVVSVVVADLLESQTDSEFGLPDGELARFLFQIPAGASAGVVPVTVSNVVAINATSLPIASASADGTVTIAVGGADVTPPVISNLNPQADSVLTTSPVTLTGTVTDDATPADQISLRVAGQLVIPDTSGNFRHEVSLVTGVNTIALLASDAVGNTTALDHLLVLQQVGAPQRVVLSIGGGAGISGEQITVVSTATPESASLRALHFDLLHDPALLRLMSTVPASEELADGARFTITSQPPVTPGQSLTLTAVYELLDVAAEQTTPLRAVGATAENPGGRTIAVEATDGQMTIRPRPEQFELLVTPTHGTAPLDVQFSVGVPGTIQPIKYEWDLDGLGRYDEVTYHSGLDYTYHAPSGYLEIGGYLPTVRVTYLDAGGAMLTETLSGAVTVLPNAGNSPTVSLSADVTGGSAPLQVTLTASVSGPRAVSSCRWDFEGDGVYEVHSQDAHSIITTYRTSGSFAPTVEVIDSEGMTARARLVVTVNSNPSLSAPTLQLVSDNASGTVPASVTLSAIPSGSSITLYKVDYEGDGVIDSTSVAPIMPPAVYRDAGIYRPVLRAVADNHLEVASSLEVHVLPAVATPPNRPQFTVTLSEHSQPNAVPGPVLVARLPLVVDVAVAELAGEPIDRLEFDSEGDGVIDHIEVRNPGGRLTTSVNHHYDLVGHYRPMVRAISVNGIEATRYVSLSTLSHPAQHLGVLSWASPAQNDLIVSGSSLSLLVDGTLNEPLQEVVFEWKPEGASEAQYQRIGSTSIGTPPYRVE